MYQTYVRSKDKNEMVIEEAINTYLHNINLAVNVVTTLEILGLLQNFKKVNEII
jgi:hypothetical protein